MGEAFTGSVRLEGGWFENPVVLKRTYDPAPSDQAPAR